MTAKKIEKPKKIDKTLVKSELDRWEKKREAFLTIYFNNQCQIQKSCDEFKINKATFYVWYNKYPDFRVKCDNVQTELRGLVDDATIKLIIAGHPETVKDARKCLNGTSKFSSGKRINYNLNTIKTLDEIQETRLKVINDFGLGTVDQDTVEIINKLLDSQVNNIVASNGFKDINEIKAFINLKSKEHG